MAFELQRPLVFISVETTGLKVQKDDRLVELAMIKLFPPPAEGEQQGDGGHSQQLLLRFNPGIAIEPEASAVSGITDDDVKDSPSFKECLRMIITFLKGCDLAAFGIWSFAVPLLAAEFARCNIRFPFAGMHFVDPGRVFLQHEPRDLEGAARCCLNRATLDRLKGLERPQACMEVLSEQVARYGLPRDPSSLDSYVRGDDVTADGSFVWAKAADGATDVIKFTFGKHKGEALADVFLEEPSYIQWMLSIFEPDVQRLVHKCQAGQLNSIQRPAPLAAAAQQPTANSIKHLLDTANKLASRAAADLQTLLQQQQEGATASAAVSALSQTAADLAHTALQMQVETGALPQAAFDVMSQALQDSQQANNAGGGGGDLDPAAAAAGAAAGAGAAAEAGGVNDVDMQQADTDQPAPRFVTTAGATLLEVDPSLCASAVDLYSGKYKGTPLQDVAVQDPQYVADLRKTLQGELDLVAEAQEFANAQALLRAPPGTRTGAPATPDGKFVWGKRHGGELTPVFNFGMHTGRALEDVATADRTYLTDFMQPRDFDEDVQELVEAALVVTQDM